MKTFLKNLPYMIICAISFVVISIMDTIHLSMLLCIKATRLVFMWLMSAFNLDCDTRETFDVARTLNNAIVNYAYKVHIDLMYPVEEDDEEGDDEDEEF